MLQPTCPRCEATYEPPRDTCAKCAPGGRPIHLVDDAALRATPVPARYLLGLVLEGRFRVDGYLGGGGMSSVYRATQRSVDRSVALKIIRADLMSDAAAEARFEQEAKVVAQLAHPYVVQVYDFGRATLDEGARRSSTSPWSASTGTAWPPRWPTARCRSSARWPSGATSCAASTSRTGAAWCTAT